MSKLKRHYIQLVVGEEKDGKPKMITHLTPHKINLDVYYDAIDTMEELQELEESEKEEKTMTGREMMEKEINVLADVVVKIYEGKFTKQELLDGLHAPEVLDVLSSQVLFVAKGEQNDEQKKFVESLK